MPPLNINEDQLITNLASLKLEAPCVAAIAGLSGSGKTTLAAKLKNHFAPHAVMVSLDDFINVPTEIRKNFLRAALETTDRERLRYLAAPAVAADNPYAHPASKYDWAAVEECLATLKSGRSFARENCWDQKTGKCDRSVVYHAPGKQPFYIFFDTCDPLKNRNQCDVLVVLDVNPETAHQRRASRQAHLYDDAYLVYKQMISDIYRRPEMAKARAQADFVVKL